MKGEKVVITGGAGFIGSHLAERIAAQNDLRIIDDLATSSVENISGITNRVHFIKKDISKLDNIRRDFRDCDTVFHLAANPSVALSSLNNHLHLDKDVIGTYNVLESARLCDVKTVVFTSSSTVYGRAKEIPTKECYGPLLPISFYGASKLACESYISAFANNYGIKTVILRLANIIGPRSMHGVVYRFVQQMKKNRTMTIFSNGEQRKPYTYVDDCINALLISEARSKDKCAVYNVSSGDSITVKTIAKAVSKEMGVKARMLFQENWVGDVEHYELDIDKLRKLGWHPQHSSLEAVRLTIKHLL
jgi:UDP-glucose 4-epimerase